MADAVGGHTGTLHSVTLGQPRASSARPTRFNGELELRVRADEGRPQPRGVADHRHDPRQDDLAPRPRRTGTSSARASTRPPAASGRWSTSRPARRRAASTARPGYSEMTAGPAINDGQWHTVQCVKTDIGDQGRRRRGRHLEVREDRDDRQHRRAADRRARPARSSSRARSTRPASRSAGPIRGRCGSRPVGGRPGRPVVGRPRCYPRRGLTHVLAHRPPPPRRTARRVRRLRDLRPRARRRAPRVLRAVRAPAPRPGVGGHRRGRPRRLHHHPARARPRLAGLQGARPARAGAATSPSGTSATRRRAPTSGRTPSPSTVRRVAAATGASSPWPTTATSSTPSSCTPSCASAGVTFQLDLGLGDHRGAARRPPGRRHRGRHRRRHPAAAGRLLDGRDDQGPRRTRSATRPACGRSSLGRLGERYCVAIESCALDIIGAEHAARRPARRARLARRGRASAPGRSSTARARRSASSSTSTSRGRTRGWAATSLQAARGRMGEILAREAPAPGADLVIPVPDSGIPAARGFARASGPARRTTASSRTATSRGRSSSPARSCASTACG